jgi:hypothetical protein
MVNTKKVKKVRRRSNNEIRCVSLRQRAEDNAMASTMSRFVQRTPSTTNTTANTVTGLWDKICHRDRNFQRRVVVESEDHLTDFGDDGDGRDDDDDDDNVDDDNGLNEDGEEGEGEDDSDYSSDTEDAGGLEGNEDGSVMCLYMKAIRKQIQEESNTMEPIPNEQRWIFNYLKEHGFWIRKECAPYICNRIGIDMHLSGYYHDVMIWLPDVQFGINPSCSSCHCNDRIGVQGYCDKTYGRRVISLKESYFIMTRKYQCHRCKSEVPRMKKYIFRGYNEESIKYLPGQLGLKFPAVHSKKLSIDKTLLSMMRPLYDAGIRPATFRRLVSELHQKEYFEQAILHEFSNEGCVFPTEEEMLKFSSYADEKYYNSFVPGANYFNRLYCKVMRGIRQFQDDTLKIRPTDILTDEATFLSVKRFKKVNGMKIVEACITLVNENDEKRSQSFTPTEAKDVMIDSVKNMVASQNEMGQNGARIIYVDNPS